MNKEQFCTWVLEQIEHAKEMREATTDKKAQMFWDGKINAFEAVLASQGY